MTDKEPTKEQWKEMLEWCGFEWYRGDFSQYYFRKKNKYGLWKYFTEKELGLDLNNLFKYAVPLAREKIGADELTKRLQGWISDVILCGINPETLLFRVIREVIKQ